MYVGRTLQALQQVPYEKWTIEELAYHQNTMQNLAGCLNGHGEEVLRQVLSEIESRGGLPRYGGDYDHPSGVIYE